MLDADIALYAMRREAKVLLAMLSLDRGAIGMSALVHSQLLQGFDIVADPDAEEERLEALLRRVLVEPYDEAASARYGSIVRTMGYSRKHVFDRMIAAHAISVGATLVTNNLADFAGVPDLRLVNWAA